MTMVVAIVLVDVDTVTVFTVVKLVVSTTVMGVEKTSTTETVVETV